MKLTQLGLVLALGVLLSLATGGVAEAEAKAREKRGLPAWIAAGAAVVAGYCGGRGTAAAYKMYDAYMDMRRAAWRNCDKYFHCRGNYDASRYGWCGRVVAAAISNTREWAQGGGADSEADQRANRYGRRGGNCSRKYILDTRGKGRHVECSLPRRLWY